MIYTKGDFDLGAPQTAELACALQARLLGIKKIVAIPDSCDSNSFFHYLVAFRKNNDSSMLQHTLFNSFAEFKPLKKQ